jgi:hypothetical protein
VHTQSLPRSKALRYAPPPQIVNIGLGLHNEPVSNYFDHFTCICLDNPTFREFVSLTLDFHLQTLSSDSSSSSSTWTTPNASSSHSPHLMNSPSRVFVGAFMGSLNQQGFPIALFNLTHVAKLASFVEQVISSIDAPHAPATWPYQQYHLFDH